MISPRFKKAARDIGQNPSRAALAVVAMAAGAFALGTILTSESILRRELGGMYARTRPASATLVLDRGAEDLTERVRALPGVLDAEERPFVRGRVLVGADRWEPLVLWSVSDFAHQRLDLFEPVVGSFAPGEQELVLERTALSVADATVGGFLTVQTAGGTKRQLRVAGTVHAPGLPPAWMDHVVTGFISSSSCLLGHPGGQSPELRIRVLGNDLDRSEIRKVAQGVRVFLEGEGRRVSRIDVPEPGRHPHADQMDTFLFMLGAFGVLTLLLSAVLIANLVHGLVGEQVREVGFMKAIGGTTRQITGVYLAEVALLAAAGLSIGVPLGHAAGRGYARFAAGILNADLVRDSPPPSVLAIECLVGIALPLLVALWPVHRASRITVREAFSDDPGGRPFGSGRTDRWLLGLDSLPRALRLGLRTAFRRQGRLILTIATLGAGGAVFISALNVSAAWSRTLRRDAEAHTEDSLFVLTKSVPIREIAAALAAVPGIERAEYWPGAPAVLRESEIRIQFLGPDTGSAFLALPLLKGRWLLGDGEVVVTQGLVAASPGLRPGDPLRLLVGEKEVTFTVVGVAKELDPTPTAYGTPAAVRRASGDAEGSARTVRLGVLGREGKDVVSAAERAFEAAGIPVRGALRASERRKAFEDHLVILKSALVFAAGLVILVGVLGLTSTLALNVIQRTREIGILGAIGATPQRIASYVVFEGTAMGFTSGILAILGAIPVTFVLDRVTGGIFIKAPLDFVMSPGAVLLWLVLVTFLSALGSLVPARRAAGLNVKDAIAYV